MILSRAFARRRMASGVRPGWIGAWGLVAADTLSVFGTMGLALWLMRGLFATWPVWASITALTLLFFIPLQIILITSALWAAKSRWTDKKATAPDL